MKLKQIQKLPKRNDKTKDRGSDYIGAKILNFQELVVQLLKGESSGKAKKYERTGPQEFVPFEYDEVMIENIKAACTKHFASRLPIGMTCDVLSSDRGPSCSKMDYLPSLKLIYIRFINFFSFSKCQRIFPL
ncbi:uncharacterized protein LOC130632148 [Hydractinia symbiolongicarpus]|uniref:uncharacterized protein LOC130632148 n=1 Tax=Hydractinia symbiolongicarpus TaxID=13093 RepID=UPI00254E1351|nr:uncharacterized protein LOC130632148 [Hydractinia symbiolongicarpus]